MGRPNVFPTGTTVYYPEECWNGYTLFSAPKLGVNLINMNGKIVRHWKDMYGFPPKFLPGGHGGGQQIMARIACEEVDMLLFFRDPIAAKPSEPNEMNLLRICDVHNIPVATNIATAEVLIHGLEHGDLDWRTILHPSHA